MPSEMCSKPEMDKASSALFYKKLGERKAQRRKGPPTPPSKVKCTTCGRKVKPFVYDCEWDFGPPQCWHIAIPPHKVKGWYKKKKPTRRVRGGRLTNR